MENNLRIYAYRVLFGFTCCQNCARRKIRSFLRIQSIGGGGDGVVACDGVVGGLGEEASGGGAGGRGGGDAASDAVERDSIESKQLKSSPKGF